jgi:hypothetical protein
MTKQKRRKAGKKQAAPLPGWMHLSAGLAIGLAVAYGIYVSDRRQLPAATEMPAQQAAAKPAPVVEEVEPEVDADAITFDFYEILPDLDVDLYENDPGAAPIDLIAAQEEAAAPLEDAVSEPAPMPAAPPPRPAPRPAPVAATSAPVAERPGIYILQAGSFSVLDVAQRRKAEMEELGVPADIKRGSVKGKTVYRVYTNPMDNPNDVNRVRTLLTGVGIDILQKRVSD